MNKYKKYIKFLVIELVLIGVVLAIDLLTKKYIYQKAYDEGKITIINGVLSFLAVTNTGASFGIFKDSTLALTIVSAVSATGLLVFLIATIKKRHLMLRSSLILIIGGALGNLVDRIWLGHVRDFVYFELINFAIFNLADSALTIGTILLMIYIVFFYKDTEKKETPEP